MAEIIQRAEITVKLQLIIDEHEARALDALAGYGDDEFIKAFYANLGKAYMQEHENGLRRFLRAIRREVPGVLARVDEARKTFRSPIEPGSVAGEAWAPSS